MDHRSLKWILTQPDLNMRQRRWIEVLAKYDFDISYTKEKGNKVADALSHKALVLSISMHDGPIGYEVKESLAQDEYFGKMVTLLGQENISKKEQNTVTNYTLDQGVLYYKLHLCIPNINEIKARIL